MTKPVGRAYDFVKRFDFPRPGQFYYPGRYRQRPSASSSPLLRELDFSNLQFNSGWGDSDGEEKERREWLRLEGIGPAAIIGEPFGPIRNRQPMLNAHPHPVKGHRYDEALWCMGCHLSYYADNLRDAPRCSVNAVEKRERELMAAEMERLRIRMYGVWRKEKFIKGEGGT